MRNFGAEKQLTNRQQGHILTNAHVWSFDGEWIVYDTRSDPSGSCFDGDRIEQVNIRTGEIRTIFHSDRGAHCGVATCSPIDQRILAIHGPVDPTADWQYSAWHRQGVILDPSQPQTFEPLDARDIVPPFTPGALRGGTHVHQFDPTGRWVSFTYEDHVLATREIGAKGHRNLRGIGITILGHRVEVPKTHTRNIRGNFSVLVSETHDQPHPGSDQIDRAYEECWIASATEIGPQQLSFLGNIRHRETGQTQTELFVVEIPQDPTNAGSHPLEGTEATRPFPPAGTTQRRITFTEDRRFPGLQGPRFWPRANPAGNRIAFLMRDDGGVVQLFDVSPFGGDLQQITANSHDIASSFTWSPDGTKIAYLMDRSIVVTEVENRRATRLTSPDRFPFSPRGEAVVFSPCGDFIAFVRPMPNDQGASQTPYNQIFVVPL